MKKSLVMCVLAMSAAVSSFQASAVTLGGLEYHAVSSTTKLCPDSTKPLLSSSKYYCRSYKANIGWSAPIKRVDGSVLPISEIAGYEVYWTRSTDAKSGLIKVKGAAKLAALLTVYTPDTYSIAIAAIDIKGMKSPLSAVVDAKLM